MSATPQPRSVPARIGVKASLTTTTSVASPRRAERRGQPPRVARACRPRPARTTPTCAGGASGAETGLRRAAPRPARPAARSPARSRSAGATSSVRAAPRAADRRCRRGRGRSSNSRRRRPRITCRCRSRPGRAVKKRWVSRKAMTGMISVIRVPAWISPGSRKWMPLKRDSPSATVWRSGVPDR